MFIGILGPVCAGKATFAKYLKKYYGFKIVDLVQLFDLRNEIDVEEWLKSRNPIDDGRSSPTKSSKMSSTQEEETKEVEKVFNQAYYLDEEMRPIIEELITKVIKILKKEWQSNWVIYPLIDLDLWDTISFRNSFITYEIDSPIMSRYERYVKKYGDKIDFMEFAKIDDDIRFNTQYMKCKDENSRVKIKKCFKNAGGLEDLIGKILKHISTDSRMYRPDWKHYFMRLAHVAASRSNCMKRSVGALIVNSDQQIIATGYNGTTFGFPN
jgi:dCMP deaminase